MVITNFDEKISLYQKSNPGLAYQDYGVLLLIDTLYNTVPDDIALFRKLYAHLDPGIIDNSSEGIMFLEIARSREPVSVIKHRLNNYINVKFNYLRNFLAYEENMATFRQYSHAISRILDKILETARFPPKLVAALQESQAVRDCGDFYEMLKLYREAGTRRIKFEILRKLGLIVLLTRISRSFIIEEVDASISEVEKVFTQGLGLRKLKNRFCYLWINEQDKAVYSQNKREAFSSYQKAVQERSRLALPLFSMQVIEYTPYKTKFNTELIHYDIRNKLRHNRELSSASVIEKIVRKNLEFPNQVHDIIGLKLVVPTENEIPQFIRDLSSFIGGSSTRKKEKNALDKFGKRVLGRHSSKDYLVWKAVYDICLPHPSMFHFQSLLEKMPADSRARPIINKKLNYFRERPMDTVVEVQVQDFDSYLLSIAYGSPTDHSFLKMNQIRQNSFYKLFPKEIYETELQLLRRTILGS